MPPIDEANQLSFLFIISGGTPMTLTTNVPVKGRALCAQCTNQHGIAAADNVTVSWIGYSAKTSRRIIEGLRKRYPRAVITLVTLLGGIETQLYNVSIQCEEQINIVLSSIAVMPGKGIVAVDNLLDHIRKLSPPSILKKPENRSDGSLYDQLFMFLCREDLTVMTKQLKLSLSLAPFVRWFILGPEKPREPIETIKKHYGSTHADFEILQSEDTVAADLMDRLLRPVPSKPILALGAKSAYINVSANAGVRAIDIIGFLPMGTITSNLSQFAYDEAYIFEIGQDPDFDETVPTKSKHGVDFEFLNSFPKMEQELLPLLLTCMIKESLAALCEVSLQRGAEYAIVKRVMQRMQQYDEQDDEQLAADETASDHINQTAEDSLPCTAYAVLFATNKNGDACAAELETMYEGPSDDEDWDDIMDELEGRGKHLLLAFLSPTMDRPGWPPIDTWITEFREVEPAKLWETGAYQRKNNKWMDDNIFCKEVINGLTKLANKRDFAEISKELAVLKTELRTRCMDVDGALNIVLEMVAASVTDAGISSRIREMKANKSA